MKKYFGISASPGIAIHHAFTFVPESLNIPSYSIEEEDIAKEWERFTDAVERAAEEIIKIKKSLHESKKDQHQLLDAQLLMLKDPDMTDQIKSRLPETKKNVEWVLSEYINNMVNILETSGDDYLADRSVDILDVGRRITNHLLFRERFALEKIKSQVILVAHSLLPSEIILINPENVRGLAVDTGGRTSHTAIIARSFGIPAVLGLNNLSRNVRMNDLLVIDGENGIVIVNPDEDTLLEYKSRLIELEKKEALLAELKNKPAETTDSRRVSLMANIEMPAEVSLVKDANAEGIGLFRSEFLHMNPDQPADEHMQFEAYRKVLEAMDGKPVTIRTLDVGGDKLLPEMVEDTEHNPLLGWRAIRFCLEEKEIFRTQLRALLKASSYGNLRIMFPLISNLDELEQALAMLEEEKSKLVSAGISVSENIPVGIMIEVPSAVMISDILARKADFFSIGTNDLIQYTMAVDRGNERIASLYRPYHPALWRMIKITVDNARAGGIPVSVCGEMAGDPASVVLFMALGIDELSMGAFSLPEIKRIIRSVSYRDASEALNKVLNMSSGTEVEKYLLDWLGEKLGDNS